MAFVFTVLTLSAVSRYFRSKELRVSEVICADGASAALRTSLVGKKVNLVPLERHTPSARFAKMNEIRNALPSHWSARPSSHVHLLDNRSEFVAPSGFPCGARERISLSMFAGQWPSPTASLT